MAARCVESASASVESLQVSDVCSIAASRTRDAPTNNSSMTRLAADAAIFTIETMRVLGKAPRSDALDHTFAQAPSFK
jgi:hypothetical protein